MNKDKILTKHPKGKQGVRINKTKYNIIKTQIINCLENNELTHSELMKCIQNNLENNFQGSIGWYAETVKLDLEARNIIERREHTNPQRYKLK